MGITTLSSRQFSQNLDKAKKAAAAGPVFIIDRGQPTHVLLTIDEYKRISGGKAKIADLLAMPGIEDIALQTPRLVDLAQTTDLS